MKHAPLSLALFLGLTAAAQAANALSPPANLVVCSRMTDRDQRLNCYDAQMAAMLGTSNPPAVAPPAVAAAPSPQAPVANVPPPPTVVPAPAPPATAEQRFGSEDLTPSARAKVEKPNTVLQSTIASIREVRPKLWLIVLGNGQIWLQEGTQATMFFHTGFDVRIEEGLLGDYRMSTAQTGGKNVVKVTRVQ